MKLSRYEQKAVIIFNMDEGEATVYTANPTMDILRTAYVPIMESVVFIAIVSAMQT